MLRCCKGERSACGKVAAGEESTANYQDCPECHRCRGIGEYDEVWGECEDIAGMEAGTRMERMNSNLLNYHGNQYGAMWL